MTKIGKEGKLKQTMPKGLKTRKGDNNPRREKQMEEIKVFEKPKRTVFSEGT